MDNEEVDKEKAKESFAEFMEAIGVDPDGENAEHLKETPRRVVDSRVDELFSGMDEDPRQHLKKTFDAPEQDSEHHVYDGGETVAEHDSGFVVQDGIRVQSMCAHHFLPFRGHAHVGYIPDDKIVGLSKLARVVEGYARRPTVQEVVTNQVADAIFEELEPQAAVVLVEAEHECMTCRGVREPESVTRTSALRGKAAVDDSIKQEFFQLVGPTREM